MRHDKTLEELWRTAPRSEGTFEPSSVDHLPPVAQRYLRHAIGSGVLLATCVRLTMTGTIKLESRWCEFVAEQVVSWDRGFVWAATAKVNGLPVTGFDRLIDGEGAMRWKILGLFPVMKAQGHQIARAAAGRLHVEAIWLPTVLLDTDVSWDDRGADTTVATFDAHGEHAELNLKVSADGALVCCSLPRWANLDGTSDDGFGYHSFGGVTESEKTFSGITIPTRHRVGWHFGTPTFEDDGEFFRCDLQSVRFR